MGSSDESSDAGRDLLSKFQAFRPTSSHHHRHNHHNNNIPSPTAYHEQKPVSRRRGRPKKLVPIINLVEESQPGQFSLSMRPSPHSPVFKEARVRHDTGTRQRTSHQREPTQTTSETSRSRRFRAPVENYYSNANYSGYVSSSDEERSQQSNHVQVPRHRLVPQVKSPPKQDNFRVTYNLNGIRVSRHIFSELADLPSLPSKIPYAPESEAQEYARRFQRDPQTHVLHVSFSNSEVEAMVGLLAPDGVSSLSSEMSPVDQAIHLVQQLHRNRQRQLAKKIFKMIRLQKTLAKKGFDSLAAYHQSPNPSNHRINSLYSKISDGEGMNYISPEYLAMAAVLCKRQKEAIRAFIKDANLGNLPTRPYYVSASREETPQSYRYQKPMPSWSFQQLSSHTPHRGYSLRRSHTWKGASNDVLNLAWSPDGSKFAVGAAAQCDEHNMQYNRSNNLILGDLMHDSIKELPGHRIPYPVANANNTHLYMSVSAVQWFGDSLYTCSYDKTVKIWDVSSYENAACVRTLRHDLKVQIMARSHVNPKLLATGTDSTLHLWNFDAFSEKCHTLDFQKQRSVKNPRLLTKDAELLPTSLAWGISARTQDLLVTGFAGKGYHEADACRDGLLAMWRMTESSIIPVPLQPNAQNTFDVKFHPTVDWLATGTSVPAMGTNGTGKHIRSLVRIYEPLKKTRCAIEFDCPALDINDVSFCPMDRFYISASCTDGVTYVWDFRNPSKILHQLPHGDALNQLDEQLTREQADVGVRVALWGESMDKFVTGGSDGVLRAWDIRLAPEDVHLREVVTIQDEIMSGAFSPDKSALLIGDAAGGIHLLNPAIDSDPVKEFNYEHGDSGAEMSNAPSDSGREIGRNLLRTGQLIQHPKYGVGQGPAYRGPYASWARPEGTPNDRIAVTPLLREIQALQLDQPRSTSPRTGAVSSRGAVDMQRKVAEIRNRDSGVRKRRHAIEHESNKRSRPIDIIDLCSDDGQSKQQVWIDLTNETDIEKSDESASGDYDADADEDEDEEDYWFPESCNVDPNIRATE